MLREDVSIQHSMEEEGSINAGVERMTSPELEYSMTWLTVRLPKGIIFVDAVKRIQSSLKVLHSIVRLLQDGASTHLMI